MPSADKVISINIQYFEDSKMKLKWSESCSVMSDSLLPHSPGQNSPGQNTGVGSLSLLQGIFPTRGLIPGFPHCRRILYQLSHKESPRILEWIAYPFSRGSSWPRNRTGVSCIAGKFFTNWATREAPSGDTIWVITQRFYVFWTAILWFWIKAFCLAIVTEFYSDWQMH